MSMVKASAINQSRNFRARGGPLRGRDDEILEDLAAELYGVIGVALEKFGVNRRIQSRGLTRSWKSRKIRRASGTVLRDLNCLGELMLAWKTEPLYIDKEGYPRVLELRGTKGTFEALARRFFPRRSLVFVVNLACQHADVTSMKSGRMALLGSSVVNTNVANSTPRALAQLVRQIDQLLLTSTYNFGVARTGRGSRRFERMCHAVISRAQFDSIMQELRPQMHDLLERVDSLFRQQATSNDARRELCVANVGIYVSRCDEIERAGYKTFRMSRQSCQSDEHVTDNQA